MSQLGARGFAIALGAVLSIAGADGHGQGKQWTYAGKTGPAKWDTLSKDFAECKDGQIQSPIDIPDASARKGDFPPILFNYKPVPLKIIDRGHTLQVNYAPGSIATIEGVPYELVHFEFHRPGEHKVNGHGREMEAQLVHRGPGGKLVIISVLFDAGRDNNFIRTLLNNLPLDQGREFVPDAIIDLADILPDNPAHFLYLGSLPTPPCTEDVIWAVMKTPVGMSADQLAVFARLHTGNSRPLQDTNGRPILESR